MCVPPGHSKLEKEQIISRVKMAVCGAVFLLLGLIAGEDAPHHHLPAYRASFFPIAPIKAYRKFNSYKHTVSVGNSY
jgi:hypothetical protein